MEMAMNCNIIDHSRCTLLVTWFSRIIIRYLQWRNELAIDDLNSSLSSNSKHGCLSSSMDEPFICFTLVKKFKPYRSTRLITCEQNWCCTPRKTLVKQCGVWTLSKTGENRCQACCSRQARIVVSRQVSTVESNPLENYSRTSPIKAISKTRYRQILTFRAS